MQVNGNIKGIFEEYTKLKEKRNAKRKYKINKLYFELLLLLYVYIKKTKGPPGSNSKVLARPRETSEANIRRFRKVATRTHTDSERASAS